MIDSSKIAALARAIAIGARMDPASTYLLVRVCCAATRAGWRVPLDAPGDHAAVEHVSRLLWVAVGDATIVSDEHIAGRVHGVELLAHLVAYGADADEDELEALKLLLKAPGEVVRGYFDADLMQRLGAKIAAAYEPLLVVHHLYPGAARMAVDVGQGRDVPSLDGVEDLLTVAAGGLLFDRARNEIRHDGRRLSPTPLLWDVLAELASSGPTEASRLGVRQPRTRRHEFRHRLREAFGEDVELRNAARKGAPEEWELTVAGSEPSSAGTWRFGRNRVDVLRGRLSRPRRKPATATWQAASAFAVLLIHHGDWVARADLARLLGVTPRRALSVLRDMQGTLWLAPGELEHRKDGRVRLRLDSSE